MLKRTEKNFELKIFFLLLTLIVFSFLYYCWSIRAVWLVSAVFLCGFSITLISFQLGRTLLFFFFPLIPFLVGIFYKNLPYNFLVLPVFLLLGVFAASLLRNKAVADSLKLPGAYFYLLIVLFISGCFLIFRWYFPFLFSGAYLKNFPITLSGLRINYGLVYPLCWLFIYFGSVLVRPLVASDNFSTRLIFRIFTVSYLLVIGVAIWQYLASKEDRVRSLLSDFNAFGSFSGMLFLGTLLFFQAESKLDRLSKSFLLLATFSGVALSGVRSAIIFVIAGLFFFISRNLRRRVIVLIIALPFFILSFLFIQRTPLYERFNRSLNVLAVAEKDFYQRFDQFSSGRYQLTVDSLRMIAKFPLSGVGTGNFCFYNHFQNFERVFVEDLSLNQHLLVFAENGIFGFIFYLFFFWQIFRESDFRRRLFVLAVFVVLGLNNFFWFAELTILFWVLITISEKKQDKAVDYLPVDWKKIILLTAGVFFVNLFSYKALNVKNWFAQKAIQADFHFGLWYNEVDNRGVFFWTRDRSGIFLPSEVRRLKIAATAPQNWLKHHQQKVRLLLNGREWQRLTFSQPTEVELELPEGQKFLSVEVDPPFIPARISRSNDRRLLGVRLNFDWQLPYRYHWKKVRIKSQRFAESGTYTIFWRSAELNFSSPLEEGKYRFRFTGCGTSLSDGFPQIVLYTPERVFRFTMNEKFTSYDAVFNYRKKLPAEILLYFSNPRWDEKEKKGRLFFFRSAEIQKLD